MKLLSYNKKKLIILTITEIVLFVIIVGTTIVTFNYMFELTFNEFTGPWIGDKYTEIASKYNIPLMNALCTIGNILLILWLLVNGIRFVIIKPKYKLIFGIGVALLFAGLWCFFSINIPITIAWILMGLSIVPIIYSHKLDKEDF